MHSFILNDLFSGMFSDELDKMGFKNQVIVSLKANFGNAKFLGPARTVHIETIETADENIRTGLGFLEKLNPGEILCIDGSQEFAYFGELMTRLSIRTGLAGIVIGGLTRDSSYTQQQNTLPIYAGGYSPKDIKGRGRVSTVDVAITINNISIEPGDWIFSDTDGTVVIPSGLREELFTRIHATIEAERDIVARINSGESINTILKFHKEF